MTCLLLILGLVACTDSMVAPEMPAVTLSVEPVSNGLTVSPSTSSLEENDTVQLIAYQDNGNEAKVRKGWWSDDTTVATVSSSGVVTGRAEGIAVITAKTTRDRWGTAVVIVTAPSATVGSVEISPAETTVSVGSTTELTATVKDANGKPLTNRTVVWQSSDTAVATVSSSGVMSAVSTGSVTILAAVEGKSGTMAVSVTSEAPPRPPAGCSAYPHDRLVHVSTAAQFSNALIDARPGDLIRLADGTYVGKFNTSASGTAGRPIVLCGSRAAVIETGSITKGGFALVVQANHWIVDGFTVTNSLQGVRVLGGQHNVIRRLRVHSLGQEAISLRAFSSNNVVEENEIDGTGLVELRYGEGVYVGTSDSQWCQWTNCEPDRSDSNVVRNNRIGPNIGSDMVDVKKGTTGTLISGNVFDGRGLPAEQRSWIIIKGDEVVVEGNRGTVSPLHGFEVVSEEGWGQRAQFRKNHADLVGGSGYGIRIGSGAQETAVVSCDNTALGAEKGLTNVACTQ